MKEYDVFLAAGQPLPERKQVQIEIRDAQTLEYSRVLAIICRDLDSMPGADRLWVRRENAGDVRRHSEPWAIRILQVVEDDTETEVRQTSVPLHKRQGFLLRSLLKEKQDRDAGGGGEPEGGSTKE